MRLLNYGAVLLFFLMLLGGCGKSNSAAPGAASIDPATKTHPFGMAVAGSGGSHVNLYFVSAAGFCAGCHGNPADLAGGISKVSCSTVNRSGISCHAGKWPHGLANNLPGGLSFALPSVHGAEAKATATATSGMSSCQKCHGIAYRGNGAAVDCIDCHKRLGSNPTTNAPHGGNWLIGDSRHSGADESNAAACAQCHLGGANSSNPHTPPANTPAGCFNNTLCHFEGVHKLPYFAPSDHGSAAKNNIVGACASCHAVGSNPPIFNLAKGANANVVTGCETCHGGIGSGLAHPQMWLPNRGAGTRQSFNPADPTLTKNSSHASAGLNCTGCHGANLGGGIGTIPSCFGGAVAGTSCHVTSPALAQSGCISCHGAPPNGAAGITGPNRDYRHTVHWAIPNMVCDACHNGYGPPNATHADGGTANTAILAKFNENGLPASYDPITGRCANVSCHGGIITPPVGTWPVWKSQESLDLTVCLNCHTLQAGLGVAPSAYNGPYIGPFSGNNMAVTGSLATFGNNLHTAHIQQIGGNPNSTCLKCHTTPGASHFANVLLGNRLLAAGFAAGTVGGSGTAVTSYSFTSPTSSSCNAPGAGCRVAAPATRSWYK